jgi:hypothetical protein
MTTNNPLQGYYRQVKNYINLPSGITYYTPESVEFTVNGEIPIMPMTSKDEMIFKNPDALLNGEALSSVIKSCCPTIKNPKKLLINDINAIVVAVRLASFGEEFSTECNCPACGEKNTYALDLSYISANIGKLDADYVVNLDNGLSIFVKPFEYVDFIKATLRSFEQAKIMKVLESNALDDIQKFSAYGKAFNEIATLNYELIVNAIIKIVGDNGEMVVTEKKHIAEFLENIDSQTVEEVEKLLKVINEIGVQSTIEAECQKCENKWDLPIDYNPVNFFTNS